jgi:hypothetical protein
VIRENGHMTTKDLYLLVLGAILGALASLPMAPLSAKFSAAITRRVVSLWLRGDKDERLVTMYRRAGLESALYRPQSIGDSLPIPLLATSEDSFSADVDPQRDDGLIVYDVNASETFDVGTRFVRWFARRGVRLFDGQILWVRQKSSGSDGKVRLTISKARYFAYAQNCYRLEREIAAPWRRPTLHMSHLRRFDDALGGGLRPQVLGGIAATLFDDVDGTYVALARRSANVLTGPRMYSVIPAFGMESAGPGSKYALFFHNYLREFCEEFFDLEELIHAGERKGLDSDWFLEFPQATAVLEQVHLQKFKLRRMAAAIGLHDGALNFGLAAHFTDPAFLQWVRLQILLNWESAPETSLEPSLELLRIDDPKLDEWARSGLLASQSVFALDLARQYYEALMDGGDANH